MKHIWTLILLTFLGVNEAELLCQSVPQGHLKYINIANKELEEARKACLESNFMRAKISYTAAIDSLEKGKTEYENLNGEEKSVRKLNELLVVAKKEMTACLNKQNKSIQSNGIQDYSYTSELWKNIDLNTPPSKRRPQQVFPWWWVVGPLAVGTGAVIIMTKEDESPPLPMAKNIGLVIDCGAGGSINPTSNDTGTNINITDFDNSTGWVTLEGNILIISTEAIESFSIAYTITDDSGRTSSAIVEVTVNTGDPVVPANISIELDQGESSQLNIFDYFDCDGCRLIGVDINEAFLLINFTPDGKISFQLNPEFEGSFSISYNIIDWCRRESTGTLTIKAGSEPCKIKGEPFVADATCGLNDGVIVFATEELYGNYNFLINGEHTSDTIRHLAPGGYLLRVEDAEITDCSETYELTIEQRPFDIIEDIATSQGNCFTSGEAMLSVLSEEMSAYYPEPGLQMALTGEGFDFQTELPQSPEVDLVQIIEMETGVIPVLGEVDLQIFLGDAPNICSQSLNFTIDEEVIDLIANEDSFTTAVGTPLLGNVLHNDIGIGLEVTQFTPIAGVTLNVGSNGSITFVSDQSGIFQSFYTIRDTCGREETASLQIEVKGDNNCELTGELTITPASCGKDDGVALLTLHIENVPNPEWQIGPNWVQEGALSFVNNQLGTGSFVVNIEELSSGCSIQLNGVVPEQPAEYISSITTEDATCIHSGNIIVTIGGMSDDYTIQLISESDDVLGEWPGNVGENNLSAFVDIMPGSYTVSVSAADLPERCKDTRSIVVLEKELPLIVANDMATINQGESWTGNVLDNDTGFELSVVSFTQAPNGHTTVDPNGNSVYTPNLGFYGETSFMYTVVDACGQVGIGTVTITINPSDCIFTGELSVVPSTCGVNDGSAKFNITDWPVACDDGSVCHLNLLWSNGATSNPVSNLSSGNYSVTVSLEPIGCSDEFNFTIESEPIDYFSAINTTPGNCIDGGHIEISFNDQLDIAPSVTITVIREGVQILQLNEPWGDFQLSNFITVLPGNYEILLLATGLPQECEESLNLEIPEVNLPLQLNDQMYTIPFGENWTGNVLDNAIGTSLVISDFTSPEQATLNITPEGDAILVPEDGFSGDLVFEFTATDICGQMGTAMVTVVVDEPDCLLIQNVSITQGNCNIGNEAIANFDNPDGQILNITLTNPLNDIFMTTTNESSITLSAMTELIGGTYLLEVSLGTCIDQLNFEIPDLDILELELLEITPPSTPDASDGSILLHVSGGNEPYIILVNGDAIGPFPEGPIQLMELPEGVYEILALDNDECSSEIIEVVLIAGLLSAQNNITSILTSQYPGGFTETIYKVEHTPNWTAGLRRPEHTELPKDIHVSVCNQIEIGGAIEPVRQIPLRIKVGQIQGQVQAHDPVSSTLLTGQWKTNYVGIFIAPKWRLGGIQGQVELGGVLGHILGYLEGEDMDVDIGVLTHALRLTPSLHIPISPTIQLEVGYEILTNLKAHQHNRIRRSPNVTFLGSF